MKPPPFSYHDPSTVADAVGLLVSHENAKILAGGQSLMPMLNMRFVLPDHVVDLNGVKELVYMRHRNGSLEMGAMTRQRDIEHSDEVRSLCPLMREAVMYVGHRQTRNRGTLGGSLCQLDPSAELVTVAMALDATIEVAGPKGTREIAIARFPQSYMTPAIDPTELVTGVRFPLWSRQHGYAFEEFARRHGDFAIVSAAALIEVDAQSRITRSSVVISGLGAAPLRVSSVERGINGQVGTSGLFESVSQECRRLEALGDVHAPASYRQHLAAVLTRRVLEKAYARTRSRQ